jgi:hypothetical protein
MLKPDFVAEARAALADPHFVEMVNAAKAVGPLFYDLTREQQESVCAALRHEPDDVYGAIAGVMAVKPAATNLPENGNKVATRRRKPTLASIAKEAAKAGLDVARYEVDPDGKIIVVTGKPGVPTTSGNPWEAEIERLTKQ